MVEMYMYLLLWCFFMAKNDQNKVLFNVNADAFIPMVPFYD